MGRMCPYDVVGFVQCCASDGDFTADDTNTEAAENKKSLHPCQSSEVGIAFEQPHLACAESQLKNGPCEFPSILLVRPER